MELEEIIEYFGSLSKVDREAALEEIMVNRGFCGCGEPEAASAFLLKLLRLAPFYERREQLEQLLPNAGVRYFVLYMLDRLDLTEHGGSVNGAWLTPEGEKLKALLETANVIC